ncbi:MAG: THUMP domain-containing protein [Candidatus Nezhaarchaeota archaeon]|nr:THUMP domain-containing protein [Candidatus Nezhaarchaeota archaeon]MCX8141904.1 THUMP domain-containing protein [Candidatus Nezhaarchaeota archaeon]MDW8050315.1 THUMP domain-containing protein [Nitrososphaerota archaeon]
MGFNLLVSTYRNREDDCISELWYLFREIGDENIEVQRASVPGLLLVKTKLNQFEAAKRIGEIARERPWDVRYTLKLTPIDRVTTDDENEIIKASVELANRKIGEHETYRITINKRLSSLSSKKLIEEIAKEIGRKVNLKKPDKILQIEIIGKDVGIAVLKPDDVISIAKIITF